MASPALSSTAAEPSAGVSVARPCMMSARSECQEEASAAEMKEQAEQMQSLRASKEEAAQIATTLLSTIRSISQLSAVEESLDFKPSPHSVDQHLAVLGTIQNVIHEQHSQLAQVKREAKGLANDILIRDATIKLLQDKICLSPNIKKAVSKREPLRHRSKSGSNSASHSHRSKASGGRDKKSSADFQK